MMKRLIAFAVALTVAGSIASARDIYDELKVKRVTAPAIGTCTQNVNFTGTVQLKGSAVLKNNYSATVDPTVNDDANDGYSAGSMWLNNTSSTLFVCTDNTVAAAVWANITSAVMNALTSSAVVADNSLIRGDGGSRGAQDSGITIDDSDNMNMNGGNIENIGSIGTTGTRITKGWFTDLECTNAIAGSITGQAATVATITGLAPDTATTQATQPNITSATSLAWTGMSTGTDGEIPTFDASGNPAFVATGTATHVLTSNGAGTAPTFQAVPADAVTSVFTRTGAVTAQSNDYTWAQIDKSTSSLADITTVSAGDITSGTLAHERGGLEADVSAYSGLIKISGGSTSQAVANTDYAAATHASRHTDGTDDIADLVGDGGAGGTHGLVPAPGAGDAAAGKYLKADGVWTVPPGGGDVSKVGTPANDQVGVWTGDGTIEGTANLTYDGSNLQLTGDIGSTGTRITKGWFVDLQVTNAIAGSITGASTSCSGQAATVATITGLAPDTATTQATQPNITTCSNLTTVGTIASGTWQADVIDHERGGLEADVSAYSGLLKISGGSTSQAVANTDYAAATHASRHEDGGADAITLLGTAVEIGEIGTATYDDVQDVVNQTQSAGFFSGFTISDSGGGEIDVAAGKGFIRTTNDVNGAIVSFDYAGETNISLNDNQTNWIYIEYNAGSPQAGVETTVANCNLQTEMVIGRVYRSGTTLTIYGVGQLLTDYKTKACYKDFETEGVVRGAGLILGETGTRNVTVTAGTLYCAHNRTALGAIDTSAADTFDVWNSSASTSADATGQTQYDNAQYWNGAALANLTSNRYGTRFFYEDFGGNLHMQYGTSNAAAAATAENEAVPTPPSYLSDFAIYLGRIVIQEGQATATLITSSFLVPEAGSVVTDHGDLAGLADDDHTQYLLADGTRGLSADWDAGSYKITAQQLESDIATGTAPFVVASTTEVANLKAATVGTITGLAPDTATTQATQPNITSAANLPWTGLKAGTDGEIPTFDSDGNPAFVATGTATHVLTSNGAGSAPTFQAVPAEADTLATVVARGSNTGNASITIGDGTADVDYTLTFNGEDNDGVITWQEDEDTFDMSCNLTITSGDLGLTGSRITKGWFTDLEVTNAIAGSVTGNAGTVTVADETTDTTCFPIFVTTATGSQAIKSGGGLSLNSNTGVLTATGFAGPLTGNVTGDCSGSSGSCTGQAATVATITGLAPDTATTQATQPNITTCENLTTVGTIGTGTWQGTAIDHERGGLETDVSAYAGLVKIDSGATSAVTITAAGEAILDDADAATQRTTLGLGNVENTALSTWAGSGNITTIGTVTSGTLSTGAVLGGVTMTLGSDADGDIYYRSSNVLTRLGKGTALQHLRMNAGATAPEWATAALEVDGSSPLTADWDAGSHKITAEQLESDVTTGTAPLVIASTTAVSNLNADQVDGKDSTDFCLLDGTQNLTADWDTGNFSIKTLVEVTAHTGTGNITAAECRGGVTTNTGATGAITLTLPDAQIGMSIIVVLTVTQDVDIAPQAGEQILLLTDSAGDAISSDATIGSSVTLIAISATQWMPVGQNGTWTDVD